MTDWLEEAEKRLDSELEISNEPDKIKVQLTKHKVPQTFKSIKNVLSSVSVFFLKIAFLITHFLFSFSFPGVSESVGVKAAGLRHHCEVWESHEGQGSAACRHPEAGPPGGRGPGQVGHRLWQERREVKKMMD